MSWLPKFAAAFLAVLLSVTPLIAATPCIGIAHSTPDCTQCCDEMAASMGMPAGAAAMQDMQGQLSQLTCCTTGPTENTNVAISQEPQGLVSTDVDRAGISIELPLLAPAPPPMLQLLPERSKSDRVYSDLCTFRI